MLKEHSNTVLESQCGNEIWCAKDVKKGCFHGVQNYLCIRGNDPVTSFQLGSREFGATYFSMS
jgi:hypothetical protein